MADDVTDFSSLPSYPSGARGRDLCPLCGSRSFSWGDCEGVGGYSFRLMPEDASWLQKTTGVGGQPIQVRVCNGCGNLQLFVRRE
jgi:hypothetical protein